MDKTTSIAPSARSEDTTMLQASGLAGLAGSSALVAAGIYRRMPTEVAAGLFYGAAASVGAVYGNPNASQQADIYVHRFERFLKSKAIIIPASEREQIATLRDQGFLGNLHEFFFQYPSEVMSAMSALGSLGTMLSGVKRNIPSRVLAGALLGTGALTGLLVREDAGARAAAQEGTVAEQANAFVAERPLRISGALMGAANLFALADGLQQYKHKIHGTPMHTGAHLSTLAAAGFLTSSALLILAHKDTIDRVPVAPETVAAMEEVAAHALRQVPPAQRTQWVNEMTRYITAQPGIHQPEDQVRAAIQTRLKALVPASTSAWQSRVESPAPPDAIAR